MSYFEVLRAFKICISFIDCLGWGGGMEGWAIPSCVPGFAHAQGPICGAGDQSVVGCVQSKWFILFIN